MLDWWLLELRLKNVGLVDAEEDAMLKNSFPELELE